MADYVDGRLNPVGDALTRLSNQIDQHLTEHRNAAVRAAEYASKTRWQAWGILAAVSAAAASWAAVAVALLR